MVAFPAGQLPRHQRPSRWNASTGCTYRLCALAMVDVHLTLGASVVMRMRPSSFRPVRADSAAAPYWAGLYIGERLSGECPMQQFLAANGVEVTPTMVKIAGISYPVNGITSFRTWV